MVKNMRETRVRSLGWGDPLEKGMAIQSSILAWRNPWTEKPGPLQFMGLQRVRHGWVIHTHTHTHTDIHRQLKGFWDLVTIKPMDDAMEKKRCLWLFSPCTQKNLEGKSEMCERYAVPFAMDIDSNFCPVSLLPLTMALAFHFSTGPYKYIKFLKMFLCQWFHQGHHMRVGWHVL